MLRGRIAELEQELEEVRAQCAALQAEVEGLRRELQAVRQAAQAYEQRAAAAEIRAEEAEEAAAAASTAAGGEKQGTGWTSRGQGPLAEGSEAAAAAVVAVLSSSLSAAQQRAVALAARLCEGSGELREGLEKAAGSALPAASAGNWSAWGASALADESSSGLGDADGGAGGGGDVEAQLQAATRLEAVLRVLEAGIDAQHAALSERVEAASALQARGAALEREVAELRQQLQQQQATSSSLGRRASSDAPGSGGGHRASSPGTSSSAGAGVAAAAAAAAAGVTLLPTSTSASILNVYGEGAQLRAKAARSRAHASHTSVSGGAAAEGHDIESGLLGAGPEHDVASTSSGAGGGGGGTLASGPLLPVAGQYGALSAMSLGTWGEGLPRRLSFEYLPLTAEQYVRTAHPRVRLAAMHLDRGCALAGALLAQYPLGRLAMLGYLLLIHLFLWAHMFFRSC